MTQPPIWGAPDQPAEPQPGAYPPAAGPAQPYQQQPHPAQPYPTQPYPAQPYPTQPYPAQPYPGQYGGWSAFKDVSGLGIAVILLSSLVTLGDLLAAATSFSAVETYQDAAGTGEVVFTAYDGITLIGLLMLPTWIVTSIWLTNIRGNAVRLAPQEVRRGAAWCCSAGSSRSSVCGSRSR